jgi:hypothetical protein
MTVPTLVRILQARGILLWLDGEQIRGRVLQGPLTRSDRALLTAHRTALLTWLRQQTAGEGAADCGTALPEPPCPPHIPYAPLPSDGPLRQCQTCPSVWYVTCPCGSIHWQLPVEVETWYCRACGVRYGAQSTAPLSRDDHAREETEERQGKEVT